MNGLCSHERLELALAGTLSAGEESKLQLHLEDCELCSAEMERLAGGEQLSREIAALLVPDELDDALLLREECSTADFVVDHLEPSDDPEVLGRLGGYDVLDIIGRGGMGVVLKGFDRELKRFVAIKALAPHLAHSALARKRFAREAQAAAAVVNLHVIAIHQVQPNGQLPFLVMPLLTGESLAHRIKTRGTLELKEILRIGMQAAEGLAAAHGQGLIHRDVKPANILLEKGVERAVLTDFGLARAADDVSMTRQGVVAGTPEYMSPEQARGEALDGRSDLFSLGCVLYEMATGGSPFRTDSTMATLRRIVDAQPAAMASLVPELPPWFCHIVERLLSKDPAQRFASASEVGQLLEQCLSHLQQPTSVPLPASLVPHAKSRRSIFKVTRKGMIAMLGTIGMTLLGMVLSQATEAPDISGQWTSDEWGTVVLEAKQPGQYEGTFTGKSGAVDPKFHGKLRSLKTGDGIAQFEIPDVDLTGVLDKSKSGTLRVKWSRVERRFNGTWGSSNDRTKVTVTPEGAIIGSKDTRGSGADRSGKISLRLVDNEIRGAWTTSKDAQMESGNPRLGDLLWKRSAVTVPDGGTVLLGSPKRTSEAAKPATGVPPDASEADIVLTVPQVIEKGPEFRTNRNPVTVRFRVREAKSQRHVDGNGEHHDVWFLSPDDGPGNSGLRVFTVRISPRAEEAMKLLGIKDIPATFVGNVIEVKGSVTPISLNLYGRPETDWSYCIEVNSPDQIQSSQLPVTKESSDYRVTLLGLTRAVSPEFTASDGISGGNRPLSWMRAVAMIERLGEMDGPYGFDAQATDGQKQIEKLKVRSTSELDLDSSHLARELSPITVPKLAPAARGKIYMFTISGVFQATDLATLRFQFGTPARQQEVVFENVPIPAVVREPGIEKLLNRQSARAVVEFFVSAALAGYGEEARKLAGNLTLADMTELAAVAQRVPGQIVTPLAMTHVYMNDLAMPTSALAISERVSQAGKRDSFLLLTLSLNEEGWFVTDIEFESEETADRELKKFLEANPKSISVPPQASSEAAKSTTGLTDSTTVNPAPQQKSGMPTQLPRTETDYTMLDFIRDEAYSHVEDITSLQYAFEVKDDNGWHAQSQFFADRSRFRVNRKDVAGMLVMGKRLDPMTISSAFDGTRQQYLDSNGRLRLKNGCEGASYGIGTPHLEMYSWLRRGPGDFRWDTICDKELWKQRFAEAEYIGGMPDNGRMLEIVDFPQRLEGMKPCAYRVIFARDLRFIPIKILRRVSATTETSTTVMVTDFKSIEKGDKRFVLPTAITYTESRADGVSLKQQRTTTVAVDSLKVNEPIDEAVFTIDRKDAKEEYDVDQQEAVLGAEKVSVIEQPLDRQNARSVVDAFVAAALAGDKETTKTLTRDLPPANISSLSEFFADRKMTRLPIQSVYVNDPAKPTRALATSETVTLDAEPQPPNLEYRFSVVFTLIMGEEGWSVSDITDEEVENDRSKLKKFLEANPNAISVPPRASSEAAKPTTGLAEAKTVDTAPDGKPVAKPDWVIAWDFRYTLMNQRYAMMRISKDGKLEAIFPEQPLVRSQLTPEELAEIVDLVAKNPQSKTQPISMIADYSLAVRPRPELFEEIKRVNVRSEIVAAIHNGEILELDLNTRDSYVVGNHLWNLVGLAAIGGSKELPRFVEVANRELKRNFPNVSDEITSDQFSYGIVDRPSGNITIWFDFKIDSKAKIGKVVLRIPQDGQPSMEKVVFSELDSPSTKPTEKSETSTELPPLPNKAIPLIEKPKVDKGQESDKPLPIEGHRRNPKLPIDRYVKSGVPLAEQTWSMPPWGAEKDGLSAGIRVIGDARIGGEVKVELWVRNSGEKDVTFSQCHRADVGLSVVAKDTDGKEHRADITSFRGYPVFSHLLLPAGHIVKVKEFTVKFGSWKNDELERGWVSLGLPAGDFKLYAKWSDTTSRGAAEGDWTGKLTTGEVDLKIAAANPGADAGKPAAKPPGEKIAKLPDSAYAKVGTPIGELDKPIEWSGVVTEGLCMGIHVPEDAVWRVGGEVKAEVWVYNASATDVKFSRSPHTDVGLSIIAKGADGKEHFADITQSLGKPGFSRLLLPAGNIVKLKELTMKLGAKKDGELVNLDLPPGDYKLRAVWSDTTSRGAAEGEWTGKLTTGEVDLKIAAADAGADAGKPAAKPPGANIVSARRHATPSPLTPQETREVIAAISKIAPGATVENIRRDADGKVRAFLPGDPEGGQIVVVTNNSGVWRAAVEMVLF